MIRRTGRTATEETQLLLGAEEVFKLRHQIQIPSTPDDLPTLPAASTHLARLTGLVRTLSDEALFRHIEDRPAIDLAPVIDAYTDAAKDAGEAVANYSAAYAELGFRHRYAHATSPDFREAREASFAVIQDRCDWTRENLKDTSRTLLAAAERLINPPSRAHAARNRTTQPTRTQAPTAAPTPPQPATPPAARRTR